MQNIDIIVHHAIVLYLQNVEKYVIQKRYLYANNNNTILTRTINMDSTFSIMHLVFEPSFYMGVHGHSHNADYSTALRTYLLQAIDTIWSRSTSQ